MKSGFLFVIASAMLVLSACGDDESTKADTAPIYETYVTNENAISVVNYGESLPKCTGSDIGNLVYVSDSLELFYCSEFGWRKLSSYETQTSSSGSSEVTVEKTECSVEEISEGYKLVCNGDSLAVIRNGADGADGKDGSSCGVESLKDNSGVKIVCGGDSVAVIYNGIDGKNGGSVAVVEVLDSALGYVNPVRIQVSDYDLISTDSSVNVLVYSKSDSSGIQMKLQLDGIYYVAPLYFSATKTSGDTLKVADGDTVYVKYQDESPSTKIMIPFVWKNYVIDSEGSISFDKEKYIGEEVYANIVLTDGDLTSEKENAVLSVDGTPYILELGGVSGVYSTTVLLTAGKTDVAKNAFHVEKSAKMVVSYTDKNPSGTASDTALWMAASQGFVQFSQDVYTYLISTALYVYDDDNLDSVATVKLTSDAYKDTVLVSLPRYGKYFYGTFNASFRDSSENTLFVKKDGKIYATYADSSTGVSQTDMAVVQGYDYFNIAFGDSAYKYWTDKAVITLTDHSLSANETVYAHCYSTSDRDGGVDVELYSINGGSTGNMRIGYLEFTDGKTENGKLQVKYGDTVWTQYTYYTGSVTRDSAYWRGTAIQSSSSEVSSSSSVSNSSSSSSSVISDTDLESSSSTILSGGSAEVEESSSSEISSSSIVYGTLTDSRDKQVYKTVTIGSQTWMAENLKYAYNVPTAELDSSSFCYNNKADSCGKYGRLYLWSAAMDSAAVFSTGGKGCGYGVTCTTNEPARGVCPEGWHLPSSEEWNTWFTTVGGTDVAGTVLKSTSGWYDSGNGEDSFDFSVLPAGYRSIYGSFGNAGYYAYFWNTSEYSSDKAYRWYFIYSRADVDESIYSKNSAFSVRCVRN